MIDCIAPTELNIFFTLLSYKDITPTEQFSIEGSEEECKYKYKIEIVSGKNPTSSVQEKGFIWNNILSAKR